MDLLRATSKLTFQPIVLYSGSTDRRKRVISHKRCRISWRLDADAIAKLCIDYKAGLTTRQLAEEYGIGKTAITRLLREQDVPLRHQGLSAEQVTRATELYAAGSSVAQVASALGFHPSSVFDALKRAGVVLRDCHAPGRRSPERPALTD